MKSGSNTKLLVVMLSNSNPPSSTILQGFLGGAAVSLGLILANPLAGTEFPTLPSAPSISQSTSATKVPAVSTPNKVVTKAKALFEQGYNFEGVENEKAKAAEAAADFKLVRRRVLLSVCWTEH